jgi:DedD protein
LLLAGWLIYEWSNPSPLRPLEATAPASTADNQSLTSPPASETPDAAQASVPMASSAEPAGSPWAVQIGLFARREHAEALLQRLSAHGFNATISDNSRGQYRVRIPGLPDHQSAEQAAQRIRSAGFPAAVIPPG